MCKDQNLVEKKKKNAWKYGGFHLKHKESLIPQKIEIYIHIDTQIALLFQHNAV
jgi:hypothetical protein